MIINKSNIPYYDANKKKWTTKSFDKQSDMFEYIYNNCFKEPGKYNFEKSCNEWNALSRRFTEKGNYTDLAENSKEWQEFWAFEETKLNLGFFWQFGNNVWYITRCFYQLLNYSPIVNKEKGSDIGFCDVRDTQYQLLLYIKLAELCNKHAAIIKKRQMLCSYALVAKTINYLFFEKNKTLKWFASDKAFIDDTNGSWKYLNTYKQHMADHTPFIRHFMPSKYPQIQQKIEVRIKDQTGVTVRDEGSMTTLVAKTLSDDPIKGVGGPTYMAWYEEGGIAPTADKTFLSLEAAMSSGTDVTGIFIIAGSVGDLNQCAPLKRFIYNPDDYNILAIPSTWNDESRQEKRTGLYISTVFGVPQAVDEFGNSLTEKAIDLYKELYKKWEKLPYDQCAFLKSQNPIYLQEAFDYRTESYFDSIKLKKQQERITLANEKHSWKIKPIECVLVEDADGKIQKQLNKLPPLIEYPIDKKLVDKRGRVVIFEEPDKNAPFYTYFSGVDPVSVGSTTTSNSVFSISIWKRPIEREILDPSTGQKKIFIEGEKMVANWRGRFDSVDKNNAYAELLIRYYNAYTLAERNTPNFINHMERRRLGHLLAKESELPIVKENSSFSGTSNSNFGFYKGITGKPSSIFSSMLEMFKSYLESEYDQIYSTRSDGLQGDKVLKTFRGYDRIDDYWFLEELKVYNSDELENLDRLVSDLAGYYIMKLWSIKQGTVRIKLKTEKSDKEDVGMKYLTSALSYKEKNKGVKNFLNY